MTISGSNNLTPANIVAGTSTSKTIKDVAIWEPNANKHTETIVASLANSLKLEAADNTAYGLTADTNTNISKFADGNSLPTYALTSLSLPTTIGDGTTVHIADVYDWRTTTASVTTDAQGVKKQFTLQTDDQTRAASVDLKSVKKLEADAAAADTTFTSKTAHLLWPSAPWCLPFLLPSGSGLRLLSENVFSAKSCFKKLSQIPTGK